MSRLRFIIWIALPVGLYLAYAAFGLPHVRWTHTWLNEGQGYDPLAQRYYLSCTFWGPFGRFVIDHPQGGKCAWIIFKKAPSKQQG